MVCKLGGSTHPEVPCRQPASGTGMLFPDSVSGWHPDGPGLAACAGPGAADLGLSPPQLAGGLDLSLSSVVSGCNTAAPSGFWPSWGKSRAAWFSSWVFVVARTCGGCSGATVGEPLCSAPPSTEASPPSKLCNRLCVLGVGEPPFSPASCLMTFLGFWVKSSFFLFLPWRHRWRLWGEQPWAGPLKSCTPASSSDSEAQPCPVSLPSWVLGGLTGGGGTWETWLCGACCRWHRFFCRTILWMNSLLQEPPRPLLFLESFPEGSCRCLELLVSFEVALEML